jgi:hypothetical protein
MRFVQPLDELGVAFVQGSISQIDYGINGYPTPGALHQVVGLTAGGSVKARRRLELESECGSVVLAGLALHRERSVARTAPDHPADA